MDSLSIIVPALNEAGTITATLHALAPAQRRGAEVVVVDGGSQDATAEVALSLADKVLIAARGRAAQLNAGAAAASGRILFFLHADSEPPEEFDRHVLAAVAGRALAWGRFDVQIASALPALRLVAAMMNLRSRHTGIATGDQGIFATRALFERVGGFPVQPLMEDIAFSRAAKRVAEPVCLKQRLMTSGRRWERRGVTRTVLLMWRLRLAYFFGAKPHDLAQRYDNIR
jgi:rSAM/selenodomain-associated transferase 2